MSKTSDNRPNIVLMVADDHGREALGCYGNPVVNTVNLDRLAGDGTRFTQAFCTTASCAASRSVILTGQHNHSNGAYGHTHGRHHFSCFVDTISLPTLLNAAGYRTGRVGKKHFAPESVFPFQWGLTEDKFGRDDVGMSEACRPFVRGETGDAPARDTRPFFLYWCSKNPHRDRPIASHPLGPNNFGNPERSFPGDAEQRFTESQVVVPPFLPDTPHVRAELAQYYQSIARLDRGVGRLLDVLRQEGCDQNTVIIYISDNGAAFPAAKTTLYEPGMCLPCIVKTNAGHARPVSDALITWADITPTILDFAGAVGDVERFHGRSFRGVIGDASLTDWRDAVFASHTFHEVTNYYPMRVLRTDRYKFIYNIAWRLDYSFASDLWESASWQGAVKAGLTTFGRRTIDAYVHRPRFELYDLQSDPDELVNLADRREYAELVASFADRIRRFQQETGDPWAHKWVYE